MGIQEKVTDTWRETNNIPDSDGFEELVQNMQKRERSDTFSTSYSDGHDQKRSKLGSGYFSKAVFTLKVLNYMYYFHFPGAVAQI